MKIQFIPVYWANCIFWDSLICEFFMSYFACNSLLTVIFEILLPLLMLTCLSKLSTFGTAERFEICPLRSLSKFVIWWFVTNSNFGDYFRLQQGVWCTWDPNSQSTGMHHPILQSHPRTPWSLWFPDMWGNEWGKSLVIFVLWSPVILKNSEVFPWTAWIWKMWE